MKKIGIVIPWFGKFRNDFSFWVKSVEHNPTVDFLLFTDQQVNTPPVNLKVFKSSLSEIEELARKTIWEGCVISKPYKLCDYKPAYGELFCEYLKSYDFWGHCDMDMYFGDIRKFVTDAILERYNRIGSQGHLSLYRNINDVNSVYRKAGNIKEIYSNQQAFCFDEYGKDSVGTSSFWARKLKSHFWTDIHFDDLLPFHYSFLSTHIKMQKLDISNLMFSFSDGKLFRYGTRDGRIECDERLYLHLQKREISIETSNCEQFSVIPPGCIVKYRVPTYNYLKRNIRDGKFWTYYIRLINKFRSVMGISAYSNLVLLPSDNYYDKKYK